jgi:hypothetical protein
MRNGPEQEKYTESRTQSAHGVNEHGCLRIVPEEGE